MLTQEKLKAVLDYFSSSGDFIWKVTRGGLAVKGVQAGTIRGRGYFSIRVLGRCYYAHRLAWLFIYGNFPKEVDHVNGNRLDNRITNLRVATRSQNSANQILRGMNSSGFKGVVWDKKRSLFSARIKVQGVMLNLGRFKTAQEAAITYDFAAAKHFGKFAKTNAALGLL
jgi:hypothetical protein